LLIATLVLSIALALLVGMPDWLASATIGIGTILTLAVLAAVIVYGRDDARAFCIGAIFPVSLIAVTVGCLFVIFAIDTVPRGATRSLNTLGEFSRGMRFSLVVGGLMALAAGRLAVFVRRRYAGPAEDPGSLEGDD
jgi:amino acid transporter